MKLYFQPAEFCVTDTGLSNSFDNALSLINTHTLLITLNALRGIINSPIIILSGLRSPEVNFAVGGSKSSYHLQGRAADITCNKLHELLDLCLKLKESKVFEEVIYYPDKNFIHVAI